MAHNRPPLAVGAIYWDALTSAQGSVELNSQEPDGRPPAGRWTRSSRSWTLWAADPGDMDSTGHSLGRIPMDRVVDARRVT